MRILARTADRQRAGISLAKQVEDLLESGVSPERVRRRFHLSREELRDLCPGPEDDETAERGMCGY